MRQLARRLLLAGSAGAAAAGATFYGVVQSGMPDPPLRAEPWSDPKEPRAVLSRKEHVKNLRARKEFDVLIIGGGWILGRRSSASRAPRS